MLNRLVHCLLCNQKGYDLVKSSSEEVWLYHLLRDLRGKSLSCDRWQSSGGGGVGFVKVIGNVVLHSYLEVVHWKRTGRMPKTWSPWVFERRMINFQEMSNFPYGNLCIVNALLCRSWEVKLALINTELSGKWSSQDYVLPQLNRMWVFSDKIHDLLKLSTDWLLYHWVRVYKELLDDLGHVVTGIVMKQVLISGRHFE